MIGHTSPSVVRVIIVAKFLDKVRERDEVKFNLSTSWRSRYMCSVLVPFSRGNRHMVLVCPHFNYGIDMVLFVMIALRNLIEAA